MKRRTFLHNASIGSIGLSFFSGLAFRFNRSRFADSLDDFLGAIGATRQSWPDSDAALEEVCASAFQAWKKTGHQAVDHTFFLCREGKKALFFVHLPHPELGTLDLAALVFQKDEATAPWQTAASLSGFQLEALMRAATALKTAHDPGRLADLLLPHAGRIKSAPGRFSTASGEVGVQAILAKNKVMHIKAAVYEKGEALWSSEYTSDYLQSL